MNKVIVNICLLIMLSSCSGYALIDQHSADDTFINRKPDMYHKNFASELNRKDYNRVPQPLAEAAHPRGNRHKGDYIECSASSSTVVLTEENGITYWPHLITNVTCQIETATNLSCFPDSPAKNMCYVFNANMCETDYKKEMVIRFQNGKYLDFDYIEVGVGCKCNIIH